MKQVLVIDDDAAARSMLQDLIEELGHEVSVAENGHDGLRRFEERPFTLVICDILMPEKEGIETIREIKKKSPDTQIIAISGGGCSGNLEFLKMAQSLGADCTIRKPFEIEVMERTISDLLAAGTK